MVRYNDNRGGWNNQGGVDEIEIFVFLVKHVSFIYLCAQ